MLINSYPGKPGRSEEAGGLVSLPEPAFNQDGAGREGLLDHREKHPEPGDLHHQQGFLPDLHPGLLHQAYAER